MKIIYIYSFICMLAILSSCNGDKLEVTNPNAPTAEVFWKTPKDADLGLTAVYNMFYKSGSWNRWIYFRYDLTSDEGLSNSPWTELKEWTRFTYFNYNFWEGNAWVWRDHYKAIFRANQVLFHIKDIQFTDEKQKKEIIAQAKFLRAFYYFNLEILFENIPIVLLPSEPGDKPMQATPEQVWAQIKIDLSEAAADLPTAWPADQTGRPTLGAAKAYLGKANMQTGDWQAAADAFAWLVDGEGKTLYGLVDNYKDNFKHTTENNKESVFEIQFSNINPNGDGDQPNQNVGSNRAQFFAPPGVGWGDGQVRRWLVDEYKKEKTVNGKIDSRLRDNIFYPEIATDFPGEKIYGRDWNTKQWGANCYFRKYQGDYYRNFEDYYSPINYRVIRFADVLLCYAESLTQLASGTPPAKAIEWVDRVRQRARTNLPALENSTLYANVITSKSLFLKRIQMERSLELCYESVRWIDLKRWKLWDTQAGLDELKSRDEDFNNFVVGKSQRLPIPQSEVDNNSNLKQNIPY